MGPIKLWYRQVYAYPDMYFFSEVEEIIEYKLSASGHDCVLIRLKTSETELKLYRLSTGRPFDRMPILVQRKDLYVRNVFADCHSVI